MAKETIKGTLFVALALCVVCSIVVSTAAVNLKPAQQANKLLDFKKNILSVTGQLDEAGDIEEQFKSVKMKLVDLSSGVFTTAVDIDAYDQRKAVKDPSLSTPLDSKDNIAKLKGLEKYSKIYIAKNEQGNDIYVLPVRGYGLWSTLYGFLALEADLETVVGLSFYEHAETPGLGGEVENPRWKALWAGKKLYDGQGEFALQVIKGQVVAGSPGAENKVDGLSGATLTTKGVDNLIKFWLGQNGYGPFLKKLKGGEA